MNKRRIYLTLLWITIIYILSMVLIFAVIDIRYDELSNQMEVDYPLPDIQPAPADPTWDAILTRYPGENQP